MARPRCNVYFVVGGRYHDFDFARLEILKLLFAHEHVRVRVAEDYADTAAIAAADALISYTCDVRPSEAAQDALIDYVQRGGRWLALHGTNSVFEWTPEGRVTAPRSLPRLMGLLGSQFIAHPPLMDFTVEVTEPSHPLVRGLDAFVVNDELYLSELHGPNRVLLHTHYNGKAQRGFTEKEWFSDEPRPVLYLHAHGAGEVLYFTLGHCRGRYDMQPLVAEYPTIERCSWESPVYYELLNRGIRWLTRQDAAEGQ
ncbi:MAG: ThuA domain-containing protein [Proteobacteria bacterium]|nr:ThuA domain-containing protein [Pseudomonadota bacterium]